MAKIGANREQKRNARASERIAGRIEVKREEKWKDDRKERKEEGGGG